MSRTVHSGQMRVPASGTTRETSVHYTRRMRIPNESSGATDLIDGPPDPPGPVPAGERRRRWPRVLLICALALLVLVGVAVAGLGWYVHSVESSVNRVDAFGGVPLSSRPQKAVEAADAQNMLILGSDSRDPNSTAGSRSDTIILAHIPKGQGSVQMVSIPRDTWVHIPKSADGRNGNTNAKINAAYAMGGIPLVVQTIEGFTGIRIDHVAVIDFGGFKEIIDALGGVDIYVEKSFTSLYGFNGPRSFRQGWQHMDG